MITYVIISIIILMIMIMKYKIHPFLALLISSIFFGVLTGLSPDQIMNTVQLGMGYTLGFVAVLVGLGALFGSILEHSGGATAITNFMIQKFGVKRSPIAMSVSGFLVAIPVFFDVALIVLMPVIYALQRKTGKSLLLFAIPLLAGLATTHAFIPPTPGPIAVSQIINANIGWVIIIGFIVGIPTTIISGLIFGRFISGKIFVDAPKIEKTDFSLPKININVHLVISIILLPLILILLSTSLKNNFISIDNTLISNFIHLIGHPFSALILSNVIAWYILGIKQGINKKQLLNISKNSLLPAGSIILITGAGGVFKEFLVTSGAGEIIAKSLDETGLSVLLFSYLIALIIRVVQGSSTVAMITAASLVAPIISTGSEIELSCIVISIAAGASAFSHVNDSGFWLVNQYLRLNEKDTFMTWTLMTSILSLTGFIIVLLINSILG